MFLFNMAKRARKSTPGLDAWTHAELASLPLAAWCYLLEICQHNPVSLFFSVTSVYRRVPVPKGSQGMCEPGDIRPIDIFSVILRVIASATTGMLRYWTTSVLHPGQLASRGGVLMACAKIAWLSEVSLLGLCTLWGVSVDFSKMFNMLSADVAVQAGMYMGLSQELARTLVFPIIQATGVWSLPFGAAPIPCPAARGLPQGMSTSVLLSELATSPLTLENDMCLP